MLGPLVTVHAPVPEAGLFADIVAVLLEQIVWLLPALDVVGGVLMVNVAALDVTFPQVPVITTSYPGVLAASPATADAMLYELLVAPPIFVPFFLH